MHVIRRDDFRCRICGRRAADYVDIELHVHHIRPHGMGGLTEAGNLITLCHTCHTGLDPHYEARLLSMMPGTANRLAPDLHLSSYEEGIRLYQNLSTPTAKLAPVEPETGQEVPPDVEEPGLNNSSDFHRFKNLEANELIAQASDFLFQVIHNTLRMITRPHKTCTDVQD
jgi:hypothetical protein